MNAPVALADYLIPFMLEHAGARGRVVRLSHAVDTILARYPYPEPINQLLGELLLVVSMLASNLKQEGILTIQLRGQGMVPLIVVDAAYGGQVRGYAEILEGAAFEPRAYTPAELVGEGGYLAITLDPGEGMQRYQGVVALEGQTITDALVAYFTHSQQIAVLFRLAVEKRHGAWVAGGFMLERMPDDRHDSAREEQWRTSLALASTVKQEELLDPLVEGETLLFRLFHEDGVLVYPPQPVMTGCRCSRERISNLLLSMSPTDRADMVVDGQVSVHCHFCNTAEKFSPQEIGLSVQ